MKTGIAIVVAAALIGGAIMLSGGSATPSTSNVSLVEGKQIVEITAKGRYAPALTEAKAGVPTVLRVKTNGTFDCTSIVRVPAVGYQANLPPTGTTDIELPPQKSGTTVQGICAMGMYSFNVAFK
jgi:plastocyanin domain-containing protein